MRGRLGCFAFFAFLLLALGCVCIGLAPRASAAVVATPVEVTNWPTPMPTQPAIPTWCASPAAWSSAAPVCGVAAVSVAHANGEGGLSYLNALASLFGLTFIGVCVLVVGLVKK